MVKIIALLKLKQQLTFFKGLLDTTIELSLNKKSMEFFIRNSDDTGYRNINFRFRLSSRSTPCSLASCKAAL
jgi:hypothetical protein